MNCHAKYTQPISGVAAPIDHAAILATPGLSKADFEAQGWWTPDDDTFVRMWKHTATGGVFYSNHPLAIARGLPVYPFS